MPEVFVGKAGEIEERSCRMITVDNKQIGVFHINGRYYAYENICKHQGGPICEGIVIGKVEVVMDEDNGVINETFSETDFHVACPWHGWEYDLETGQGVGDKRKYLNSYAVKVLGDELYVVV